MHKTDVVIIGAGAAGLMCAATAGYRGRRVLVIDHANKAGKKILMSGGGRCNFTHLNSSPQNFLSANPAFCISALRRYTPQHFLELVERHGIDWVEKTPGQLFCRDSSKDILRLLLSECNQAGAEVLLQTTITGIRHTGAGFVLQTSTGAIGCDSLVIASGGLSIPKMGASHFGYQVAEQFSLPVLPVRAALVPFTLQPADKEYLAPLSGISFDAEVSCNGMRFREPVLITHRGLSGPAILQISSYWQPGEELTINLLPEQKTLTDSLRTLRNKKPGSLLQHWLTGQVPKRLAIALCEMHDWHRPLQEYSNSAIDAVADQLQNWRIKPAGTEGYRTAEVTLGGVDTRTISSQTFEAMQVPGLYFIGEVLDVTGHLGGHNFQWAWASGWCAGGYV